MNVLDRFGENVATAVFCASTNAGCVSLAARREELGYRLELSNRELNSLTVRAPQYEASDFRVDAARAYSVRLRAKGRLQGRLAFDRGLLGGKVSISLARANAGWEAAEAPFAIEVVAAVKEGVPFHEGDLPFGRYVLSWSGRDVLPGTKRIDFTSGESAEIGEIRILLGRRIDGFVLDANGGPVANARIQFVPSTGVAGNRAEARTGVDGAFEVEGLAPDTPFDYVVTATGLLPERGPLGASSRLVFSLQRAPRIVGRVLGDHRALEGAELAVSYLLHEEPREVETEAGFRSGLDGRFEVARTRDGSASLDVSAPGFRPARKKVPAPGPESPDVDLGDIVLSPGREISGVVRAKSDGRLLPAAAVSCHVKGEGAVSTTSADGNGRFVLEGLPASAPVSIVAALPGFGSSTMTVAAGIEFVELELAPAGRIEGRVCGPPEDIVETRLSLERAVRIPGLMPIEVSPDADGTFRFVEVEPGDWYVLKAWKATTGSQSYVTIGTSELRGVSVRPDAATWTTIGCEGFPVSGRLLVNGVAFQGAYGELTLDGIPVAPLRTNAGGTFSTRVPRAGAYEFVTVFPAGLSARPPSGDRCVVRAGGATGCDLRIFVP